MKSSRSTMVLFVRSEDRPSYVVRVPAWVEERPSYTVTLEIKKVKERRYNAKIQRRRAKR